MFCTSTAGLLYVQTLKGTSDGDISIPFIANSFTNAPICFLSSYALQWYKPTFYGIMDNCTPYAPEVVKSIQDVGALVHLYIYTSSITTMAGFQTFSEVKLARNQLIEREITQIEIVKLFCYKVSWRLFQMIVRDGLIHNCKICKICRFAVFS